MVLKGPERHKNDELPKALQFILGTYVFISSFDLALSLLLYRLNYIKYGTHFFFLYASFLMVFSAVLSKTPWGYSYIEDSRANLPEDRVMVFLFEVKIKHIIIDAPIIIFLLLSIGILLMQVINIVSLILDMRNI